jgi:hypothetical protein
MNLRGIGVGDIVLVDKKGRRFHAEVTGKTNGRAELDILPLEHNISYRKAAAHDIAWHWRSHPPTYGGRARSRPRRPINEINAGQELFA